MTWPQYLRGEVTFRGLAYHVTGNEKEMLLLLLLRRGYPVTFKQFVAWLYDQREDGGPLMAANIVSCRLQCLKRIFPGVIVNAGRGSVMIECPRDNKDT